MSCRSEHRCLGAGLYRAMRCLSSITCSVERSVAARRPAAAIDFIPGQVRCALPPSRRCARHFAHALPARVIDVIGRAAALQIYLSQLVFKVQRRVGNGHGRHVAWRHRYTLRVCPRRFGWNSAGYFSVWPVREGLARCRHSCVSSRMGWVRTTMMHGLEIQRTRDRAIRLNHSTPSRPLDAVETGHLTLRNMRRCRC